MSRPNVLFIMCDQFRFDCIHALGNRTIRTPNLDRLVQRGISYTNAYSPCPVCVPARYVIRTGCEPYHIGCYCNENPEPLSGAAPGGVESYCGDYLARAMGKRGYRTFGIGKFHTSPDPYEDLGYEVQIHTEEIPNSFAEKQKDGYASYILNEHPEYAFVEQLHGERTNMYYIPQMSPMPAEHTVEAFVARKAVEQIQKTDDRPYFGFVSFIGPHPPAAPPIPYNRMYDPDGMQNPVKGTPWCDGMDEQIAWMNYLVYADDINDSWARNFKSRYYGEITYIDHCLGTILDEVEKRDDADNTIICFFADHGDMLGDHGGWQKEAFFEQAVKVPFLVSWPQKLQPNTRSDALVSLTDLFGIATGAAGDLDRRDGIDLLGGEKRDVLFAAYGRPASDQFKMMVRTGQEKYIYMKNGGREQLFDLEQDPYELVNLAKVQPDRAQALREILYQKCTAEAGLDGSTDHGQLNAIPFTPRKLERLHQFDFSEGILDYIVPSGCDYMSQALFLKDDADETT